MYRLPGCPYLRRKLRRLRRMPAAVKKEDGYGSDRHFFSSAGGTDRKEIAKAAPNTATAAADVPAAPGAVNGIKNKKAPRYAVLFIIYWQLLSQSLYPRAGLSGCRKAPDGQDSTHRIIYPFLSSCRADRCIAAEGEWSGR